MAKDSCLARVAAGIAVGGAVGGAVGAVYGTYEAIRYKVPGVLKIRHIGQTTLGSAAVFGLFLGAGSLIHCGKPSISERRRNFDPTSEIERHWVETDHQALASTGRCGEVKLGQIRSLLSRAQTLSEKWASQGQATEWYIQVLVIIGGNSERPLVVHPFKLNSSYAAVKKKKGSS
ncbi:hypothetical protein K1719_014431 [Acacia pycnantha]|nr:hypothetical protein K1719_014431 [Acacia pycnantha]